MIETSKPFSGHVNRNMVVVATLHAEATMTNFKIPFTVSFAFVTTAPPANKPSAPLTTVMQPVNGWSKSQILCRAMCTLFRASGIGLSNQPKPDACSFLVSQLDHLASLLISAD